MLSHSLKSRIEFHDLSPRGESHVFIFHMTELWSSVAKPAQVVRRLCDVARLLQRPVTFAMCQSCFQVIIKVVHSFATPEKCSQASVDIILLLSHGLNVTR